MILRSFQSSRSWQRFISQEQFFVEVWESEGFEQTPYRNKELSGACVLIVREIDLHHLGLNREQTCVCSRSFNPTPTSPASQGHTKILDFPPFYYSEMHQLSLEHALTDGTTRTFPSSTFDTNTKVSLVAG